MIDKAAVSIASIFGIEIRLHISVSLIFVLIVFGVGNGVLLEWHPDWSSAQRWGTAIVTGLLFFASLLAHELSHAIVAKMNGIDVPRITLFLFGGVAEMENEAPTPGIEFRVAAAGPIMSFVLSFVFFVIFHSMASADFNSLALEDQIAAMGSLSTIATASYWLASVNFVLAVFNLVPGFPLDGGRLFRAFLWWRSGDLLKATRRAADSGKMFGWVLIGLGLYLFARGDAVGGMWLAFIGWFISRLAGASVSQLLMDRALKGLSIRELMRTRFETVDSELPVDNFVNDYLLRGSQTIWPVRRGSDDVGLLGLADIAVLEEPIRHSKKVGEVMRPLESALQLNSQLSGRDALKKLSEHPEIPLPVVQGNQVVGLVHQGDILRWMSLHIEK